MNPDSIPLLSRSRLKGGRCWPVAAGRVLVVASLWCAVLSPGRASESAHQHDKAAKPAPAAPVATPAAPSEVAVPGAVAASAVSGERGVTSMRPSRRPMRAAAAGPVAASAPARAASAVAGDPLDRLRDRLTRQLGAESASPGGRRGTPVVKVENSASGELRLQAPAHGSRPAAGHGLASGRPAGGHAAAGAAAAHGPAWGYRAALGPEAWAGLHPSFSLCGKGQRQSPIDIREGLPVDLESVQFNYRPGFFSVTDNGHTVQVQVGQGNSIEVGARRYELAGFHFHLPAEERVEGKAFAMSVHLVHRDAQGRLAVVALLVEEGPEHPGVQAVWNHLPLERGELVPAAVEFDPSALLPARRGYYTYMGSLTTPPCTEGVLWIVMQQTIQVSPQQLAIFARLYPMNARPVQPLNSRVIKQSR